MTDDGVLLIDLDDTLIDRQAGLRSWATRFLRNLGRDTRDELAWVVDLDGTGLTPVRCSSAGSGSLRSRGRRAGDHGCLLPGVPTSHPATARHTYAALAEARAVGWKICIVTNGGSRAQVPKISPELAAAVDGWVISETVGVGKPDPRILHVAAAEVDCRLTPESWLIGDRPETDVLGAVRAGIRSVWISRGRRWDSLLPYRPTLEASTIADAVPRILAFDGQ